MGRHALTGVLVETFCRGRCRLSSGHAHTGVLVETAITTSPPLSRCGHALTGVLVETHAG